MIGSAAIGAWIAHIVFWSLLAWGLVSGELRLPQTVAFVILWLGGRFALSYFPDGAALFPSFIAILDIALVFIIFKGDVRLT